MLRRLLTPVLAAAALVTVAAPAAEATTFICVYGGVVYDELGAEFIIPGNIGQIPTVCLPSPVPVPREVRDLLADPLPDPL